MKPVVAVFDSFFPDVDMIREDILKVGFKRVESPFDGISYPDLCADIPKYISEIVKDRLSEVIGHPVRVNACFSSLRSLNTPKRPHSIHSDRIVGQYSAHIYLSHSWEIGTGTSFWAHPLLGLHHTDQTDHAVWNQDTNDESKWTKLFYVQGKFNRLVIHDATMWHRADPESGWGEGPDDGRIVLTTFFDTLHK